jgi:hypothetical protein
MNFGQFQMPRDTARSREQELGPGDLVVFTRDELFIGVLWNDRFDNRVAYMPFEGPESFLARLDEACAKWVLVGKAGGAAAGLGLAALGVGEPCQFGILIGDLDAQAGDVHPLDRRAGRRPASARSRAGSAVSRPAWCRLWMRWRPFRRASRQAHRARQSWAARDRRWRA